MCVWGLGVEGWGPLEIVIIAPAHPFHLRAPVPTPPSPPRANGCSPMPPPPLPGAPNAPAAPLPPPPPPLADSESGAAAAWASGEEWSEEEEEEVVDLEATACRSGFRLCAANVRGLPLAPPAPAAPAAAPGALLVLPLLVLFAPSPADDREGDVEKGILAGSFRGLKCSLFRPPTWMRM